MARARTIKPKFLRSRSMRAVSGMARLTFVQLWLVADDAGRVVFQPLALARQLYPGDPQAIELLPGWLDELERQQCIERYAVDRLEYVRIVNWHRHQKISHPTPGRLPARPAALRKESGELRKTFARESEKLNGDGVSSPLAQFPERFATPREALGKNPSEPCATGSSPGFTSDSGGEGFFGRAAVLARRALARVG